MHKLINLILGILLVAFISISFFIDFGGKELTFSFVGIVLLTVSVAIRQRNMKKKR